MLFAVMMAEGVVLNLCAISDQRVALHHGVEMTMRRRNRSRSREQMRGIAVDAAAGSSKTVVAAVVDGRGNRRILRDQRFARRNDQLLAGVQHVALDVIGFLQLRHGDVVHVRDLLVRIGDLHRVDLLMRRRGCRFVKQAACAPVRRLLARTELVIGAEPVSAWRSQRRRESDRCGALLHSASSVSCRSRGRRLGHGQASTRARAQEQESAYGAGGGHGRRPASEDSPGWSRLPWEAVGDVGRALVVRICVGVRCRR